MAALIAERKTQKLGQDAIPNFPSNLGVPMAASAKCFAGGLVARDASGNAVAASASAALFVLGVAEKTVDNSTGIAGALLMIPRAGCFLLNNSSAGDLIAASNIGQACYVVDDNTVALTSAGGTRPFAGTVVAVDSGTPPFSQPTGVWVQVGVISPVGTVIQTGTAVLVAGTKTVATGISVSATSTVLVGRKAQGGTVTSTVQYEELGGSRVTGGPGTGTLVFQASVAAGTVNAPDTSTLEYTIIG